MPDLVLCGLVVLTVSALAVLVREERNRRRDIDDAFADVFERAAERGRRR